MNRSRLLLLVASILAGTAVALVVLGIVYNLVFVVFALPFAAAAYFMWADATGTLRMRWARDAFRHRERKRAASRGPRGGDSRYARNARADGFDGAGNGTEAGSVPDMDRREALDVLGVDPDADEGAIREAYRERVKEVHPDAEDGDEEAFKRVTDARDRLLG